jgi:tripartite-type tricarboxylate transporter receptor subunit TctC
LAQNTRKEDAMKSWIAACAGLAIAFGLPLAGAQTFPSKPVKILVGVTPGGTTDTLARFLAQEMAKELGQPVVVENRAGAGGNIAAEAVAKSPADGYTLLFVNTSHSVNMGLYGDRVPYDAVKDFTPITQVSTGPAVLIAAKNFPGKDAKDLIAMAKAQPGKLDFAVGGLGTSIHMAGELLKMMAGVDIVNIPYKGSMPALTDVIGGQVTLMFAPVINAVPQVKAGKVKALGVTSAARIPALPDVPSISDVLPGYECSAYFGLLGPARLPKEVTVKLHAAAARAAQSVELKARLEPDGSHVVGGSPEEFTAFLAADVEKWRRVVKATGAKPG